MKKKTVLGLSALFVLCLAYLISYLMLKGVAAPRGFRHVILLVFFIVFCSSSRKLFWFIIFPMTLVYAIYLPVGMTYGAFNYNFLIAALATDTLEAGEFIHQIPYINYLYALIVIAVLIAFRYLIKRLDLRFYRNQTFLFIALILMMASQAPAIFPKQIKSSIEKLYEEYQKLEALRQESNWGESQLVNSNYDNYILVIGESARKDYHHAYGYPVENTPFMSNANGVLIDGLTAGGTSTVPSLKAMLTFNQAKNWDADYSHTVIDLAKSAGIKTYWLSNQGYLGTHDTPISAMAKSADQVHFLKYGEYNFRNSSDFELLEELEQIIKRNPFQKKLIILHLYGSHPNACDRIEDYHKIIKINDPYYSYLNCYISSIHKTDNLLQQINTFMGKEYQEKGVTYSMLYFADHGHAHREINGILYFNNNRASKLHYDIPLFMTSSDIDKRKECQSFKSGLNFTNGIATWMGIKNSHLASNYDLFNCQNDPDDFGLSQKIEKIELASDPAINLKDYQD